MKEDRLLKVFACFVFSLAIACTWVSGQNPPANAPGAQPGPRGQTPPPQPGPRIDPALATPSPALNFLNTAIEINAAEVELGQLAATKAQSKEVKTYAQMLVKDHSAGLKKLLVLRADDNQSTPALNSEHQALKTKLSGVSGAQFDREYIDAMVNGHRGAAKLFDEEISAAPSRPQSPTKPSESDVVAAAKEMLPTIKHHLEEGERIQKTLK